MNVFLLRDIDDNKIDYVIYTTVEYADAQEIINEVKATIPDYSISDIIMALKKNNHYAMEDRYIPSEYELYY